MKTLTLICLLLSASVYGQQNKIGNLTVIDSVFSRYIIDCYKNADTLKIYGATNFYKDHADELKYAISHLTKVVKYPATIDTLYDGDSKEFTRLNGYHIDMSKVKKITYRNIPSGEYTDDIGFLIPRKPTEQDFIKWYAKTYSK